MNDSTLYYEGIKFLENEAAVLCDGGDIIKKITYSQVFDLSNKIKDLLIKHVQKQSYIGLAMEHNVYIPSIVLSLRSLGHPFIFLEKKNSGHKDILEEIGLNYIITVEKEIFLDGFYISETCQNADIFIWKREILENSFLENENIFSVIQTSGTTGQSKLIKVENICIESNACSLRKLFNITSDSLIYFGTPLTFDPSLIEVLLALISGGCLLISKSNIKKNPTLLFNTLFPKKKSSHKSISVLQIVPSIFLRWSTEQIKWILDKSDLKILAFGGEIFPSEILSYDRSNNLRIFNLYGITEVSCWATAYEVKREADEIYLGSPLNDTLIEVRNKEGVIKEGQGEIFIGSNTRFCYVTGDKNKVIFRSTGDLGIINANGLKFLGRKNDIFKRFGNRVSLNKIENTILKEINLTSRCVWSKDKNKLLAFVRIENFTEITKPKILDKIKIKLLHVLPKEEFPDYIDLLTKFPTTLHGKIDTRSLERIYLNSIEKLSTRTPSEVFVIFLEKYLGFNQSQIVSMMNEYSFFELGGNSISAIQLLGELKASIGELPTQLCTSLFEEKLSISYNYLKNYGLKLCDREDEECGSSNTAFQSDNKRPKLENEMNVLWIYNLEGCVDSTPLIFHHKGSTFVAVGSFSQIFVVLNANTGSEEFRHVFSDNIGAKAVATHCGNFLYVSLFDGTMSCIDFSSKSILWSYPTDGPIKCSPCFVRDNTALVFGSYDKNAHCIDSKCGKLIWKTFIGDSIFANPITYKNIIIVTTTGGHCISLSEENGHIYWRWKAKAPIFSTPCFLDDQHIVLVTVEGVLHCLELEGIEKYNISTGSHVYSSLVINKDLIIFGGQDHNLYFVKTTSQCCQIVNKIKMEGAITSTLFIYVNRLKRMVISVTNTGILNIVESQSAEIVAEFKLPSDVFSSPEVFNDKIYVGCRDNNLYCISFKHD